MISLKSYFISISFCLCLSSIVCSEYKQIYISKYCQVESRRQTIELDEEEAVVIRSGNNFRNYMDCSVSFRAEKGYGIIVTVKRVNLRDIVDKVIVDINDSLHPEWTGSQVIDNKERVSYVADRKITIRFLTQYSSESTKYNEFIIILSPYRKSTNCKESEISCAPNRCVSSSFLCDGHNNCGDNSDEILCLDDNQTSNLAIVGTAMAGLVVVLLLCYCCRCCCCCCGSKKNRKDYIPFSSETDRRDIDKVETTFSDGPSEPSAPVNTNDYLHYGSAPNQSIRYPVNPNYPYFIDNTFPRPQSSDMLHNNYMSPPPPYSPKGEN